VKTSPQPNPNFKSPKMETNRRKSSEQTTSPKKISRDYKLFSHDICNLRQKVNLYWVTKSLDYRNGPINNQ